MLNLIVAVIAGLMAKNAFENNSTIFGWLNLIVSAVNFAFFLDLTF